MKPIHGFLALVVSLFLLAGCATPSTAPTATEAPVPEALVPSPMTWEQINSLPVANDSMSEQELRQLCADYFRMQLTFQWTVEKDLTYSIPTYSKQPVLKAGTVYAGIPYISPSAGGNLYTAMSFYDPQTGLIHIGETDVQDFFYKFGNHCTSGSFWGWARVVNSTTGFNNSKMNADNGYIPIGDYAYPTWDSWSGENTTKAVCENNGRQVMFESYALLQMADGIFTHLDRAANSHMRMVAQDAVVVRNADGSIDGQNSYVLYLDQGSTLKETTAEDGTPIMIQGGVDQQATFQSLYDSGYIPFTFAEFIGQDPVEKSTIQCNLDGKDSITLADLFACTIESNYAISHATVTVTDPNGNQMQQAYQYAGFPNKTKLIMDSLRIFKNLLQDEQTVTVTCHISTGECFTVYSGPLTK